jgi:hypothetical protein
MGDAALLGVLGSYYFIYSSHSRSLEDLDKAIERRIIKIK